MGRRARRPPLALATALTLLLIPVACGSNDTQEARDLVRKALRKDVRSADVSLALRARLEGLGLLGERPLRLTLAGPLRSNGPRRLPSLDWKLHAEGAGRKLAARVILVPRNVFIEYRGARYEVGERLVGRFGRRLGRSGDESPSLRALGVDPAEWIDDGEVEDGEAIGGDATRKVSGKLRVERVLRDLNEVLGSPELRSQLPPGQRLRKLSDGQIDEVDDAVEDPPFEVSVGRRDGILRRFETDVRFELSDEQRRDAGGLKGGSVSLAFQQTSINGNQRISPPSGARPLSELLRRLGIPPALLGGSPAQSE